MNWLVGEQEFDARERFQSMLQQDGIIKAPGAHDAISALIAKRVGFDVLYLSGGAISSSLGFPDLGLITLSELVARTREIYRATGMPLIVDVDTGFGSTINVTRTVSEMEECGASAIQIEDQEMPKKCGHLNGKKLIPQQEMVQKILAAKAASQKVKIIARTDALAVEGLERAIERANAYVEAGADIIFPEALSTEGEFRYFARRVRVPLLANMTEFGKTDYYTAEQFADWGYKIVIYPVTSLRVAAKAVERVYQTIRDTGTQKSALDDMQTRKELYDLIGHYEFEALDNRIAKTKLD